MSRKHTRCDACNKRIRPAQHELLLRDLLSGQEIGRYHTRPECQSAVAKYLISEATLRATIFHPKRCGDDLESCDGGLMEGAA